MNRKLNMKALCEITKRSYVHVCFTETISYPLKITENTHYGICRTLATYFHRSHLLLMLRWYIHFCE